MKIIHNRYIPFKPFVAITFYKWIFVRKGYTIPQVVIRHEEIHYHQQKEMLIILFLLWYILEFIFRLIQYRNWMKAYRNISFEREAYTNENNKHYDRKMFQWLRYL